MADPLKYRKTRYSQLNEKVTPTEYDILYPETVAKQVITDPKRRFVTDEQIEAWTKGVGSLHYRGEWVKDRNYIKGDIVRHENYFFICGVDHLSANAVVPKPEVAITFYNASVEYWYNMDYISRFAELSKKLKTDSATNNQEYFITFVNSNNSTADPESYEDFHTNKSIKYNPFTQTLTVTNIKGKITEAIHADKADHALKADDALHSDKSDLADTAINYTNTQDVTGKTNIQESFENVNERIDKLIIGETGTILKNPLFVQKNGEIIPDQDGSLAGFNGSKATTINIDIRPADVQGLLNSVNKIDNKWLPDSILGNLRYSGTVNEEGVLSGYDEPNITNISQINYLESPEKYHGIYFLVSFKEPTLSVELVGIKDVRQGDWLVCNGAEGWVKVDNTDAVTMVNSQIGAVEIYKGSWQTNSHFYRGDVVKYENTLYIVNRTHDTTTNWSATEKYYEVFGRLYQAADGIKLDGTTFKHDVTLQTGTNVVEPQLKYGDTFTIPAIKTDAYGHTVKVDLHTYTLPAAVINTWRPVQVNSIPYLDEKPSSGKINFTNGNLINLFADSDAIRVDHTAPGPLAGYFEPSREVDATPDEISLSLGNGFAAPDMQYDAYGHLIAVTKKVYRLPTVASFFKHRHFDIVLKDGVSTVQAFNDPTMGWLAKPENSLKFYIGSERPQRHDLMNFNGELEARKFKQINEKDLHVYNVVDSSATLNSGKKFGHFNEPGDSNTIVGKFIDNTFELGDSGIIPGVYSVLAVNEKGIAVSGGSILEFGHITTDPSTNTPSQNLAIGGLFFREVADPDPAILPPIPAI